MRIFWNPAMFYLELQMELKSKLEGCQSRLMKDSYENLPITIEKNN